MNITAQSSRFPEDVRQQGKYVLFVEGTRSSIDTAVLSELMDHRIRVDRLGPSFSVRSVAEALHESHPYYFFLIDRDNMTDEEVDRIWCEFPDPEKKNLLVWHFREIENAFLDPIFLAKSRYYADGVCDLQREILQFAQKRLYLDVADDAIVTIRNELKTDLSSLSQIKRLENADSESAALTVLKEAFLQARLNDKVGSKTDQAFVEKVFYDKLLIYTGGRANLEWGVGSWVKLMRGKKIFHQICSLPCFDVKDIDGLRIDGPQRIMAIAEDLVRNPPDSLPKEFAELRRLIFGQISSQRIDLDAAERYLQMVSDGE